MSDLLGFNCQKKGSEGRKQEPAVEKKLSKSRGTSRRFWNKPYHRVSATLRQEQQSVALCRLWWSDLNLLVEMVLFWSKAIL